MAIATGQGFTGIYSALPERCIRLLRLLSWDDSASKKFSLELTTHDIDKPELEYYALSYTWKSPIATPECDLMYATERICVAIDSEAGQGVPRTIGRNLYEALYHVWNHDFAGHRISETYLWVDEICINQDDLEEKEQQVRMMGNIYAAASAVVAWLGVDDPDQPTLQHVYRLHTKTLDAIRKHESTHERLGPNEYGWCNHDAEQGVTIIGTDILISAEAMRALFRFYRRRRYISRAWIAQEVTLAHNCLFLFGDRTLTLDRLHELSLRLRLSPQITHGYLHLSSSGGSYHGNGLEFSYLWGLFSSRQDPEMLEKSFLPGLQHESTNLGGYSRLVVVITQFFSSTVFRQCFDPRDVLYSAIGIIEALCPGSLEDEILSPDYKIEAVDLYINFASTLLLLSPQRSILSLVCEGTGVEQSRLRGTLPSWVPDFTLKSGHPMLQDDVAGRGVPTPRFLACGPNSDESLQVCVEQRDLHIYGRYCDQVEESQRMVAPYQDTGLTKLERLRAAIVRATKYVLLCIMHGPTYPTGCGIFEAVIRTMYLKAPVDPDEEIELIKSVFHERWCLYACTSFRSYADTDMIESSETFRELLSSLSGKLDVPTNDDVEWWRLAIERAPWLDSFGNPRPLHNLRYTPEDILTRFMHLAEQDRRMPQHRGPPNLFTTEKGYMGRSSKQTQVGDELWLLCGANVPFVLRPTGDGKYELLNEAFVYGAMFGEFVDNGVAGEIREVVLC